MDPLVEKPAPIVLFVYNRLWHTQKTIVALQKNELAGDSELFIYSDAAKSTEMNDSVEDVRNYIRTIGGFSKIRIIQHKENQGLAKSIIDGVTSIINQYGKVIVLEDDLVTSPYFLKFMNQALDMYADKTKVWHINGWNYPIPQDNGDDIFFCRVMNCWGWATWADRWQHFEKDTDALIKCFSRSDIKLFNLDGAINFWSQVLDNKKGRVNTWAIYWYATIFQHNGICLTPVQTFIDNTGHDGSGQNCLPEKYCENSLNQNNNLIFHTNTNESEQYVKLIKNHLRVSILSKIKRFITRKRNALERYFRQKRDAC